MYCMNKGMSSFNNHCSATPLRDFFLKLAPDLPSENSIISCKKRVASPGSMHGTECLGLVHWDDPEGGEGREEGGGFRMGNAGIPVADSFRYLAKLIQHCKV